MRVSHFAENRHTELRFRLSLFPEDKSLVSSREDGEVDGADAILFLQTRAAKHVQYFMYA